MGAVGDREQVWERPGPEVLEPFASLEVTSIADTQYGHGVMSPELRRLTAGADRVVGSALTATITPGNGRVIRRAIELAVPDDVLIVNGSGNVDRAVLGGNVLMSAAAAGIRAVIVDGAIRDVDEADRLGLPVVARSVCPRSGSNEFGKGEVGRPIACGGVVVLPGDVIVMDADGVVVIPRDDAREVTSSAQEMQLRKGSSNDFEARWARAQERLRHRANAD